MELTTIFVGVLSYIGGVLSGFVLRMWMDREKGIPFSGNNFVLIMVTGIWAISMIVDILSPAYETSPLVHGLMGAIVGFFYRPQPKV